MKNNASIRLSESSRKTIDGICEKYHQELRNIKAGEINKEIPDNLHRFQFRVSHRKHYGD